MEIKNNLLTPEEISLLLARPKDDNQASIADALNQIKCFENMPELNNIFIQIANTIETSLQTLSKHVITFDCIKTYSFFEYVQSTEPSGLVSIFHVENENKACSYFSPQAILSLVNQAFGSNKNEIEITKKQYTSIEKEIINKVAELICSSISSTFSDNIISKLSPCGNTNYSSPNDQFADKVIVAHLLLDLRGQLSKLDLVFAESLMSPFKKQFNTKHEKNKEGLWKSFLSQQASDSPIELQAIIKDLLIPLNDISKWEKGHFIPLYASKNDEISFKNKDNVVLKGNMGRKNNNIVVKISKRIIKND